MKLGKVIKERRKELKLTMKALANTADVDRTYISKIESKNRLPAFHVLLKLEATLGIDLKPFYYDEKGIEVVIPPVNDQRKLAELGAILVKMNADTKSTAIKLIRMKNPKTPPNEATIKEVEGIIRKIKQGQSELLTKLNAIPTK